MEASPSEGDRLVAVPYRSFDAVSVIVGDSDVDVGMNSTFWRPYKSRVWDWDNRRVGKELGETIL